MNPQRPSSSCLATALACASALLVPGVAGAQAWNADKGSTSFFIGYGNNWSTKHYLRDGVERDSGHTRSQVVTLGVSHALTDRLSLSASIPYVQAKYMGSQPHPRSMTHVDDGAYHGTLQDLRLELRYQVLEDPFAFTPFVSGAWPTRDYATMGHASQGRGLDVYTFGFYAGRSLDPWIPNTYVQGRYGYTFVETGVAGISNDRSSAGLEIGYFLTPQLGLRALASWQETYGGISIPIPRTDPLFRYHDKLAAEDYLNAGLGLSYSLTHEVDVSAVYGWGLRGRNGHKLDDGLSLGVAYSCHCAFRQVGERMHDIQPRNR